MLKNKTGVPGSGTDSARRNEVWPPLCPVRRPKPSMKRGEPSGAVPVKSVWTFVSDALVKLVIAQNAPSARESPWKAVAIAGTADTEHQGIGLVGGRIEQLSSFSFGHSSCGITFGNSDDLPGGIDFTRLAGFVCIAV
jgi:hypothetical protein